MIRKLALLLLNDDNGISAEAYDLLVDMLSAEDGNDDIINAVKATDGRYYLPEDFTASEG